MSCITSIKLKNFKRFPAFKVDFDPELNVLIGDNEAGKSSILTAIDIVLSGSKSKVEAIGLEGMFNVGAIEEFFARGKKYDELPVLWIELYLDEQHNPDLNGKNNSESKICDGLKLICEPNDDLSDEIREILAQPGNNFPFEYYTIQFKSFSDYSYTGYKRFLRHVLIDNAQVNNEYATREYVKAMYAGSVTSKDRQKQQNEYRKSKEVFKNDVLSSTNQTLANYAFGVRNSPKANLLTDLILTEDEINIEQKGKGKQCFIKTEFALNKHSSNIDAILLEEPENHLSHLNMKRLIRKIRMNKGKQLFITTHNNLISTRLDLRKSILLNSNSVIPVLLKDLKDDTAKFFIKAPDNNIIEFVLSSKVILVEGDAEFMLIEEFFKNVVGEDPDFRGVHILSVGGKSFKRYLDLAKMLGIKTAVVRDNDGDYQKNCVDNYAPYANPLLGVFADTDASRYTFEVCVYQDNASLCETLFAGGRQTLSVQEYMLKNKADVAFELLENICEKVNPPSYIKEAIQWING
ncbi:ATP-dependent nuclease [Pedobacter helvus]|uniref:ATP-dependent nuclease n=1 Tax=Pedobacter helvus TaxID=2563444 RepID=A0ABW9JLX3_9SPHI|nr:AAA family ATPase [Pedobacter ureilyticus]